MSAHFELNKGSDGQFKFSLKDADGNNLLRSEAYKQKTSAENGIKSVQSNCSEDARYERKTSTNSKFFFNLKAANHQVIGTSKMYDSEDLREAAINTTKKAGSTAEVKDNT